MKQGCWATFPDGLTTAPGASPVLQSQGKAETAESDSTALVTALLSSVGRLVLTVSAQDLPEEVSNL